MFFQVQRKNDWLHPGLQRLFCRTRPRYQMESYFRPSPPHPAIPLAYSISSTTTIRHYKETPSEAETRFSRHVQRKQQ